MTRCAKAAVYGKRDAARRAAREAEVRHSLPWGAFQAYPCPRHGGFHIGRRNGLKRWLRRQERTWLDSPEAMAELGERVVTIGKAENTRPRLGRLRLFAGYEPVLERRRRGRLSVPRSYPSTPESRACAAGVEQRVAEQMALNDRFVWRRR